MLPYRRHTNTSEEIADNTPSQWETPAGAQEKADKAEENAKEYTDHKVDPHIENHEIHLSPEDRVKLDEIEEGAEVNQNAFSFVQIDGQPTISADGKTAALKLKNGVGILLTTNPNTGEVMVTATTEAIPGPHGSTHTEHGADAIPNATQTEGGLMSSSDKTNLDVHLSEHYFLQEDEPEESNPNTLWFEVNGEVNFNGGGVSVYNATVSDAPPLTDLWFEIV